VYDIIRSIYSSPTADGSGGSRVGVLQQTLSQLRLTNIATPADEEYIAALSTSLAPCVLRPRTETSLTMEEKHAYKLVRDLFAHKDAIFSELKRMSSLSHSSSVGSNRPRAISTDESNRKALVEERNRALLEKASASRSRATSPAPNARGHRRDRSTGGPETRFPIQTSPTSTTDRHRSSLGSLSGAVKRVSLGPDAAAAAAANLDGVNDSEQHESEASAGPEGHEKKDSASWSGTKFVGGRRVPSSPPSESTPRGVTLEDKPMDD
jgi:hypothetical protein